MISVMTEISKKYVTAFLHYRKLNPLDKDFLVNEIKRLYELLQFLMINKSVVSFFMMAHCDNKKKIIFLSTMITFFKLDNSYNDFINLIIKNKRVILIPLIIKILIMELSSKYRILFFDVKTSHTLDDHGKQLVDNFIKKIVNNAYIKTIFTIDKELIYGIRIKNELLLWENSLHKKLSLFRKNIMCQVGL